MHFKHMLPPKRVVLFTLVQPSCCAFDILLSRDLQSLFRSLSVSHHKSARNRVTDQTGTMTGLGETCTAKPKKSENGVIYLQNHVFIQPNDFVSVIPF